MIVVCCKCGKKFKRVKAQVTAYRSHFCSRECRKVEKIQTSCNFCGKDLFLLPGKMRLSKNHYCNRQCLTDSKRTSEESKKASSARANKKYRERHPEKMKVIKKQAYERHGYKYAAKSRVRAAQYYRDNRLETLEKVKARNNRDSAALSDTYIKKQLHHYGLKSKDIPQSLVEMKRAELKLMRTIKENQTCVN